MQPSLYVSEQGLAFGIETYGFLEYYAQDFFAATTAICQGSAGITRSKELMRNLYPVRFLRTEDINSELYAYLKDVGWEESSLAFLRDEPVSCPSEPNRHVTRDWNDYYSDELLAMVRQRERLLIDAYELGLLWCA